MRGLFTWAQGLRQLPPGLSCHTFKTYRLRLFIRAAACILMHSINERTLSGTNPEKAP